MKPRDCTLSFISAHAHMIDIIFSFHAARLKGRGRWTGNKYSITSGLIACSRRAKESIF